MQLCSERSLVGFVSIDLVVDRIGIGFVVFVVVLVVVVLEVRVDVVPGRAVGGVSRTGSWSFLCELN